MPWRAPVFSWTVRKPKARAVRAYYAMFDAARAALLAADCESAQGDAKTHRSLIAAFGKCLVQPGRVDAEFGRSLNRVQSLRMTADDVGEPPSHDDAAWAIGEAQAFIDGLRGNLIVP